jgi:hypothetical protein
MTSPSPKVVLQAHATRSVTAMTLLLHGNDRGALERKSALSPVIVGMVLTVLILAVNAISVRISDIIATRG